MPSNNLEEMEKNRIYRGTAVLKDQDIRLALMNYLMKRHPKPARVVEELTIDNGNAIADVVACYKELHCYEIKGQTDNVRRVLTQSEYYSLSFPKLTLVTTENHLNWAITNIPEHWGLILARSHAGKVILKHIRKATTNHSFSKRKALMMLWKAELTAMANAHPEVTIKKSYTREDIAEQISHSLNREDALIGIQSAIVERNLNGIYNKSNVSGS
ncbi:sce7726 family protein [Pseudomonas sp. Pseusp97]|uniref:sce7726 family protein n=1 Tax=Pseudomonas sp. Pseusp97 TaxID=3243065 RepID=UPI0039A655C8